MAISVSSTGYYSVSANSALDPPSGDFAWLICARSPGVSSVEMLIDQWDNTNQDGCRIWFQSDGTLKASIETGGEYDELISTSSYDNGTWHVFVGQRNGAAWEFKIIPFGVSSLSEDKTGAHTHTGAQTVADDLHIMADQDLSASQYAVTSSICEILKIDRALTNAEIIAVANGMPIAALFDGNEAFYWPAYEHASTAKDLVAELTITAASSSHATAEHAPVTRPIITVRTPGSSGSTYTLMANYGSFAETGEATGLIAARYLATGQGTFSLTGEATNLLFGHHIAPIQGSFGLAGQATSLTVSRLWSLAQGDFVLTGEAAAFRTDRLLALSKGDITLSGQIVGLVYSGVSSTYTLAISQGAFALTGQMVGTVADRIMQPAQGSFVQSGQSAGLLFGRLLAHGQGSFSFTGEMTGLRADRALPPAYGNFSITGQIVSPLAGRNAVIQQGSFNLTGEALTLTPGVIASPPEARTVTVQAQDRGITVPVQSRTSIVVRN